MKRFLTYVVALVLCWLVANSIRPVYGLYRLHAAYPYMQQLSLKIQKAAGEAPSDMVVVGCSNLQHNIDMRAVQKVVPGVDFMYYSGSQNSTFLQYISDAGFLSRYRTIVFYAPYQMFEKNNFIATGEIPYESTASFDYAADVIWHNPMSFFYDWSSYYHITDSIKSRHPYIPTATYDDCVIATDHYVDSLVRDNTSYAQCNEKFDPERHRVVIPAYGEEDLKFINSIAHSGQSIRIILSPIPDIKANIDNVARKKEAIAKLPNLLNTPPVLSSSLFYDQWYHLNKCARGPETDQMITLLQKIRK